MFVHDMNILRFFSKSQTFCYRQTGMTTSCVGGNIFSKICLYLDINNRGFEFFFLLADIEREKWVKWLVVARCYGGSVVNSSKPKNLTQNKAAPPYTLEHFWLENDRL